MSNGGAVAADGASSAGRLRFLEVIRGIAALAVVIEHALELWVPGFSRLSLTYFSVGRVGVVAFFLVSGYVIGLTLTKQTIRVFAIRRFWRLFPVYWIVLVLAVVVNLPANPIRDHGALVFVANLLMLQGLVALPSIIGSAWTLGPELLYYSQAALAKYLGKLEASVFLGYFWLAVYAALSILGNAIDEELPATAPLMLFFASFGHSLFLRDRTGSRVWVGYLLSTLTIVPLCSVPLLSSQALTGSSYGFLGFNLSMAAGVLLFAAFSSHRETPGSRGGVILPWLGGISYALYLLHLPVMDIVRAFVSVSWWGIPTALMLSLLVAWCVHRWVELPLIDLGRAISTKPRPAAA